MTENSRQAAILIETISILDQEFQKEKIQPECWKHFAMEYYLQLVDAHVPFLKTVTFKPFPLECNQPGHSVDRPTPLAYSINDFWVAVHISQKRRMEKILKSLETFY